MKHWNLKVFISYYLSFSLSDTLLVKKLHEESMDGW